MATKRIANQVHRQASRLLREGYIQREPAWFRAVLDNPPLPPPVPLVLPPLGFPNMSTTTIISLDT